jgi:hypothetical protein
MSQPVQATYTSYLQIAYIVSRDGKTMPMMVNALKKRHGFLTLSDAGLLAIHTGKSQFAANHPVHHRMRHFKAVREPNLGDISETVEVAAAACAEKGRRAERSRAGCACTPWLHAASPCSSR